MAALLQCLSHSPLKGFVDPDQSVLAEVDAAHAKARAAISAFDPELVVIFAPDHFNGFFYDNIPPFAIGTDAFAIGDFGTPRGRLSVPMELAEAMASYVVEQDIDVAVSYRMQVDHGFAQPLGELLDGLDNYPVIPVFINAVAPPLPSNRRALQLGRAIGEFLKAIDKRVLLIGSGGLSHEPPVPGLDNPEPLVVDRLKGGGRHLPPEERDRRTQRVIQAAKDFTLDQNCLHPLAPEWDLEYVQAIANKDFSWLQSLNNQAMSEIAGKSAHEVKAWTAAVGAMHAINDYTVTEQYYKAIPEWIAGYGMLTAIGQ